MIREREEKKRVISSSERFNKIFVPLTQISFLEDHGTAPALASPVPPLQQVERQFERYPLSANWKFVKIVTKPPTFFSSASK